MSKRDDRYAVTFVAANKIKPSPENEELYGSPDHDSSFDALVDSVEHLGLEEPLTLTDDNYIMSGHRRFDACWCLEWEKIPCRIKHDVRRSEMSKEDYMRLLAEYNPQRVKTVDAILRETFLQLAPSSASDIRTARDSMSDELRSTFNPSVEPDYMEVDGTKVVDVISEKRMQFLRAVVDIVEKLKDFWPLSIRQIHYQLLNDPPLKQNPQPIHIEALAEKNTLLGIMRPVWHDSGDAPQPGPFSSSRIAAQSIFELPTQLLSSRFWGANPTNQP